MVAQNTATLANSFGQDSSGSTTGPVGSGMIGYASGLKGDVTQITSRSTGVTVNAPCGQITTDTSSLAAAAEATFTVTNSCVNARDAVIVNMKTITTGLPVAFVTNVTDGSFDITISNLDASTADTSADVINFCILKCPA